MTKILSTLFAVALMGPAALTFADDSAAAGAKKAGEEAMEAGAKADKAGEVAERAGAKAEKAGELADRAGLKAEKAGEKAVQAGDKAQRSVDTQHQKYTRYDAPGEKNARQAIAELKRADADLTRFFDGAAGYAVFATVGKGGLGVGGAHGTGVLYEKGMAVGKATLTQLTVGLQVGGQSYTEVIFFETEKSLSDFKKGEFAMAAQVSAVAAAAGASKNAKYVNGVSVFTLAKGGLMAEASVGGQKFGYAPFKKAVATSSK